ncbi:MAG: PEGA domain-containing protein [Deltaproteobacteria bacterium]|nr:PEGA domain-containing protein [Deltaproteobacteria bacterium]
MTPTAQKTLLFLFVAVLVGQLTAACSEKQATLVLAFSPSDASVTIDGYRPSTLKNPHTFQFYRPGDYRLEVSAKGYVPVAMMISVKAGELVKQTIQLVKQTGGSDTPNVIATEPEEPAAPPPTDPTAGHYTPGPDEFRLNITSEPIGAKVMATASGGKSTLVLKTPASKILSRDVPWHLTISFSGHESVTRTIVAPQDAADVNLHVNLIANSVGSLPGGPIKTPPRQQIAPTPTEPSPPPFTTNPSEGLLSVDTVPWTAISINGKSIGNTPIHAYPLSPGTYKILMENRDQSKRKIQTIHIQAGQHIRLNQEL